MRTRIIQLLPPCPVIISKVDRQKHPPQRPHAPFGTRISAPSPYFQWLRNDKTPVASNSPAASAIRLPNKATFEPDVGYREPCRESICWSSVAGLDWIACMPSMQRAVATNLNLDDLGTGREWIFIHAKTRRWGVWRKSSVRTKLASRNKMKQAEHHRTYPMSLKMPSSPSFIPLIGMFVFKGSLGKYVPVGSKATV